MTATIGEIMNLAAVAAMGAISEQENKVVKVAAKGKRKA